MSVITCDRKGCNNVMCDHRVIGLGDICDECIEEFKNTFNSYTLKTDDILVCLQEFMQTRKGDNNRGDTSIIDEFFKQYKRD